MPRIILEAWVESSVFRVNWGILSHIGDLQNQRGRSYDIALKLLCDCTQVNLLTLKPWKSENRRKYMSGSECVWQWWQIEIIWKKEKICSRDWTLSIGSNTFLKSETNAWEQCNNVSLQCVKIESTAKSRFRCVWLSPKSSWQTVGSAAHWAHLFPHSPCLQTHHQGPLHHWRLLSSNCSTTIECKFQTDSIKCQHK